MQRTEVFVHSQSAGVLEEITPGSEYRFIYSDGYSGHPVSLTMPITDAPYTYNRFPPFFEGLLPEGYNLEALLRIYKIESAFELWMQLILCSFLEPELKDKYLKLVEARKSVFQFT